TFVTNFNPYTTIGNYTFTQPGEAAALQQGTYNGTVGAISFMPLYAAGGTVTVNAGTLAGNGSITAYGGPSITVTNYSPDYLLFSDINIPNANGGQVVFLGTATTAGGITVTQSNPGSTPVVNIQELYNQPVPSNNPNGNGPSVFLSVAMNPTT